MKFPYHVTNRHGTVLAGFTSEPDAQRYAKERAAGTYQTPRETFRVVSMLKPTKAPNGRLVGECWGEYESRESADYTAGPR
jgi:hypothetical protein